MLFTLNSHSGVTNKEKKIEWIIINELRKEKYIQTKEGEWQEKKKTEKDVAEKRKKKKKGGAEAS